MSEATDEAGYSLIQIKASIVYLEGFNETEINMKNQDFYAKVEEQSEKCNIKYKPEEFVYKFMK